MRLLNFIQQNIEAIAGELDQYLVNISTVITRAVDYSSETIANNELTLVEWGVIVNVGVKLASLGIDTYFRRARDIREAEAHAIKMKNRGASKTRHRRK
ncbi:MAG: hypothetical protein KF899_13650 [Parvibaculum sp.]|nr:hypothetical protein [Parvibaculum sp.]